MSTEVEVAVEIDGQTRIAGTARFDVRRGMLSTSFTYLDDYLSFPGSYPLDPALPFDARGGFTEGLPGAFADSAPDRWGRRLIARRLRVDGPGHRTVAENDYLLGVSDLTRQGALRFRTRGQDEFERSAVDVPKQIQLPTLYAASDKVARSDGEDLDAVKVLLDAGTGTLGGARPKASVRGDDGVLYIAKFPHHNDEWDVMAWEKTALDLAENADLTVPPRRLTQVSGRSVLLLARFDRAGEHRVGYMSAMTLMQSKDGEHHDYVDLGEEVADVSDTTEVDLAQLWRRMAFSVLIHNTDDHLRNHGFLRTASGWTLSPVFDVNPNPDEREGRQTAISGAVSRDEEVASLLLCAPVFGLDDSQARSVLGEVSEATRNWREVARTNGVTDAEIKRFEGAFEGLRADFDREQHVGTSRASTSRGGGRVRGKTTRQSNSGSYRTHERAEPDVSL